MKCPRRFRMLFLLGISAQLLMQRSDGVQKTAPPRLIPSSNQQTLATSATIASGIRQNFGLRRKPECVRFLLRKSEQFKFVEKREDRTTGETSFSKNKNTTRPQILSEKLARVRCANAHIDITYVAPPIPLVRACPSPNDHLSGFRYSGGRVLLEARPLRLRFEIVSSIGAKTASTY